MIELYVTAESIEKTIPLTDNVTVFGRSLRSANVALDWDRMVSSKHFQIEVDGDFCVLTDLGSTNGTKVNGNVTKRASLRSGDVIQVGTTLLTVVNAAHDGIAVRGGDHSSPFATDESFGKEHLGEEDLETERRSAESFIPAGQNARVQQVCLRVTSQWDNGRVFWFGVGNQLIVGRSSRADCAFPSDQFMSSEHCRVTCTESACHVEDLQSRGGTWLNGETVKKANLFDGDQLRAGNTVFAIEVLTAAGAHLAPPATRIPLPTDTAQKFKPATLVPAKQTRLSDELIAVVGQIAAPVTAPMLIPILAVFGQVHFIVDFSRTGLPIPAGLDVNKSTLFPWLPVEAAKRLPVVMHLEEWSDWSNGVEEAWGSDALEIVSGRLEKEDLVGGLRELSRKTGAVEGIVGLCWPSVLRPLLASAGAGLPGRLFDLVSAVACEGMDPAQWQIACKPQDVEKLKKLGFDIQQSSENEEHP